MTKPRPWQDRLWEKIEPGPDWECWPRSGARDGEGYGMVRRDGARLKAHRLMWEYTYGPIPEGLKVLHRCDNPPCCNPDHLFLGTQEDNIQDCVAKGRQVNTKKTRCPQGHPYSGDNLHIKPSGGRACRACDREQHRESRARKAP